MATLSSGDTLSLADLRDSTSATDASISSVMGSTPAGGSNISFSSFALDSVDTLGGFTYGVENTTENYTLSFSGGGSNHDSKLAQYTGNFTWTVSAGTTITIGGSEHKTATISFSDRSNTGTLNSVASNTLRVVYDESYNGHIGAGNGMGANKDKTLYTVDSYDGNTSALCIFPDTPITLQNGTTKLAEDVIEGDVLKGWNLTGLDTGSEDSWKTWDQDILSGTYQDVVVRDVIFSFAQNFYTFNDELTTTWEHPLFIKSSEDGKYKFKEAGLIEDTDKLIKSIDGSLVEVDIDSIELSSNMNEIISLNVESADTYISNGFISHNKGANTHTDFSGPGTPTSFTYNATGDNAGKLTWVRVIENANTSGVTGYDVQVDDDINFGSPGLNVVASGPTALSIVGLFSSGTYYARVRAVESGLRGSWTSTLTFTL